MGNLLDVCCLIQREYPATSPIILTILAVASLNGVLTIRRNHSELLSKGTVPLLGETYNNSSVHDMGRRPVGLRFRANGSHPAAAGRANRGSFCSWSGSGVYFAHPRGGSRSKRHQGIPLM